MTKQDWRNEEHYAYTKKLDNKGWAWEFIRRRDDYLRAYEERRFFIEENFEGDWSKEEPFFSPTLGSLETFEDWEERRKTGKGKRILNDTQSLALQWGLYDMYNPCLAYDAKLVRFDLTNPYPAFFATSPERAVTKGENVIGLQDFRELLKPKRYNWNEDIVYVAFDAYRPLPNQIAKAQKFLTRYQDKKQRLVNAGKPQKKKFPLYVQMLDAIRADGGKLTPGAIIQEIDRDKKFKGYGGYKAVGYKEINNYGEDVLDSARAFRDTGYLNLLFKIRNTD